MLVGIKVFMDNNKSKINYPSFENCTIAIVGLGYVGLPLAIEFSKTNYCLKSKIKLSRKVIGFDINKKRIEELKQNYDKTREVNEDELKSLKNILFTNDFKALVNADVFIVTVPTPIDESKIPFLGHLISASKMVGEVLRIRKEKSNSAPLPFVIYESTVYPGATEEICIPEIEQESGLKASQDFKYGYSPERINPGDNELKLTNIVKLTSGNSKISSEWIDKLYSSIVKAGTFRTDSINIAEAAKVIENTQRDLNIALVNEFSLIFSKMNIDTLDVLEAASTKWNFLKFYPGIVGGHCIGVDPYYLTYKSQIIGYYPEVLLSGRRINDSMGEKIVEKLVINMIKNSIDINGQDLLILGLTFKENCPDIRNTGVLSITKKAIEFGFKIDIIDPYVEPEEAANLVDVKVNKDFINKKRYSAVIVAVGHDKFKKMEFKDWENLLKEKYFIFDLKGIVSRDLNVIRP